MSSPGEIWRARGKLKEMDIRAKTRVGRSTRLGELKFVGEMGLPSEIRYIYRFDAL